MKLLKLKYDPKKRRTLVRWTQAGEGGIDELELDSPDEPHPDLLSALQDLAPIVLAACDWHEMEHVDTSTGEVLPSLSVDVRGITIKEMDDDFLGEIDAVLITAMRPLDWIGTPLVVNTPLAPAQMLPHPRAEELIEKVGYHALRFAKGVRAPEKPRDVQSSMFVLNRAD